MEAGVGTIEKLGGMTPEELEAIPGIRQGIGGPAPTVAVNAYYSQFEEQGQGAASAPAAPEAAPEGEEAAAEPAAEAVGEASEAPRNRRQRLPEGEENAEQSGTMEDAGSPTQKLESAVIPEDAGSQGDAPGGE